MSISIFLCTFLIGEELLKSQNTQREENGIVTKSLGKHMPVTLQEDAFQLH